MFAAIVDGEMESISLKDYRGKYVILFFYPKVSMSSFLPVRSMLFMSALVMQQSGRSKQLSSCIVDCVRLTCPIQSMACAWRCFTCLM